MTPVETARVMAFFAAAYSRNVEADTIAVWADALETMDAPSAMTAAKRMTTTEDRFPSLAAFLRAAREENRIARLAAAAPTLAPGEATYRCRCGSWNGWELVEDGNPPTVAPCRYCRPLTHEQWAGGHFAPDHSCADCERRRRVA